jgi:DNA invertase Pin-like site-specific DNA recombinase
MKSSDRNSERSVSESDFRKGREGKGARTTPRPKAGAVKKNSGRPACLDGTRLEMLLDAYYSRPYSIRDLADMFGVSRMTVWRAVQGPQPMEEPG